MSSFASNVARWFDRSPKVVSGPLSLLCWNIWFDRFAYDVRMSMIMQTIADKRPDLICLQEVLPKFVPVLLQQSWAAEYDMSDDGSGSSVAPYGVLIMTKKILKARYSFYKLPTNMARRLLTAEIIYNGAIVLVATIHLESLNSQKLREKQLRICEEIFRKYATVIFCGDFNFCSYRNFSGEGELENKCLAEILPSYQDVWPTLHPEEKGFTFDSTTNPSIHQFEQMRYDRVMCQSLEGVLEATSISIEGTLNAADAGVTPTRTTTEEEIKSAAAPEVSDPYATPPKTKLPLSLRSRDENNGFSALDLQEVFPSDHYGLLTEFAHPSAASESTGRDHIAGTTEPPSTPEAIRTIDEEYNK